ncbi:hypothetical protein BDV24DRAFT_165962 [Aspergillus arachidicola]|uniref:Aldehyde dehydrogenase domain-containing protein n=1 Tax=Aspergillus arachidicola TaxID=656916 RepID=A0A2G7FEZ6_9EURO|nr:hypothetical protein BDV24DRAFT_165962 [Aspergillus arachidicola]PIG79180.1 hypothetical protein AARAC_011535 [Aspergillus arachidicola]
MGGIIFFIGYKSYVTSAGHLGENYAQPTVLADMTHDMRLASEETFRPVAALSAFDEEEVIREANMCESIRRLFRVAEALEVGIVGANTGIISNVAAPEVTLYLVIPVDLLLTKSNRFGGVKESGFGREGCKYGIDEVHPCLDHYNWRPGVIIVENLSSYYNFGLKGE